MPEAQTADDRAYWEGAAGWLAGAALYPIDMLLTRRMAEGPTTEMVLCRRPA